MKSAQPAKVGRLRYANADKFPSIRLHSFHIQWRQVAVNEGIDTVVGVVNLINGKPAPLA